jgi:hypothetical protein
MTSAGLVDVFIWYLLRSITLEGALSFTVERRSNRNMRGTISRKREAHYGYDVSDVVAGEIASFMPFYVLRARDLSRQNEQLFQFV